MAGPLLPGPLVVALVAVLLPHNQALPHADHGFTAAVSSQESAARQLLEEIEKEANQRCNTLKHASWAYASDITEEHKKQKLSATSEYQDWYKSTWKRTQEYNGIWENFQDSQLKRQFKLMKVLGSAALDKTDLDELNALQTEMVEIYSTAKVCDYWDVQSDFWNNTQCNLQLEPDMTRLLESSRSSYEMSHLWSSFRDQSGRKIKDLYKRYVELSNKAALKNGFQNMGDMWLEPYADDPEVFRESVIQLLDEMKPLYLQLHAYARRKLREVYGSSEIGPRSPIPAHLLGNMWAQQWNRPDIFTPYPEKVSIDVSPNMKKQGYTAKKMFQLSEEFFVSLNMSKMTPEFWKNSIIEKPEDRKLICHASAWDFCDKQDFRVKQCTDITMGDFITVHHEMGHTQYQMAYSHLPYDFRGGANPGFHEAVGDVIGLSVSTPKHLHKMDLLKVLEEDSEADINFLLSMALNARIIFLPFGYVVDRWRWDVFSGKVDPENWNCHWWDLRYSIQGIKPPVKRSELDFDPGSKYHVPASVPYIRYFASFIMQFQFHKSLCILAKEYDPQDPAKPLHKCDIYQSTEAGNALRSMLELGASKPWPETLKSLTGVDHMDAGAIREYFKPLELWLEEDNRKHGEHIGWEADDIYCEPTKEAHLRKSIAEASAQEFLARYNEEAGEIFNDVNHAAWNYNTNLTDHNAKLSSEASLRISAFSAKMYNESLLLKDTAKLSKSTKRALNMVVGAVLPDDDIKNYTNIRSNMTKIYGSGKVCSDKENNQTCLSLDPELQDLMKNSKDFEKLKWAWEGWRTAVGRKLKPLYFEYAELKNKAAQANNYTDYGHQLRMRYESENFEEEMLSLYDELKPLYELLHSWVRRKFYNQYGPKIIKLDGPLPACILGDMWGRFWSPLFEFLQPYPSTDFNLDATMKEQGYNVTHMFNMGEEFFTSMGLKKMPPSFWNLSMLEKPSDGREVVCHATAWDFSDGKDFRIKMCTTVTFKNLQTIHHELGHIQYYMQYAHQPAMYRSGANDGFHEAIGELMSMSMSTPQHLKKVGLMNDVQYTKEDTINFLLKMSLSSVSTLPFHLVNDLWRWRAFRGEYKQEEWNNEYWKLKEKYLGVYAPVERTKDDLDPPTIFHIANNYDMIRYFTRTVLQFQFMEALCDAAGHIGPLYTCDIYGSTEAGKKLASVLSLGSSVPWQDALEKMTGVRKMSTKPLLKYFEPLKEFLKKEVCLKGDVVGWGENIQNDYCKNMPVH